MMWVMVMVFVVTGTKNHTEFGKIIEKLRTIGYKPEDELFQSLFKGEEPANKQHFALRPELQGLLRVWESEFVGLRIESGLFGLFPTLKLDRRLLSKVKYTIGVQCATYFVVGLKYIATSSREGWFNQCGKDGDDFWTF
mmetsp:Transcript_3852/g.6259  ORF Transcript_3852/g.6259 Transcript_3852/m.6259 type:complete len:139 (+) Transcript_3852:861-1277(+)